MKRVGNGFSGTVTPLFSTMMGVTPTQGEGSGLYSESTGTPLDTQPIPTTAHIPQSSIDQTPTPTLKTYKSKKTKRAPSSIESTPLQPVSPLVEHSPQENIERETIGVSPNYCGCIKCSTGQYGDG